MVVMDSKGYSGANADNLKQITFISRVFLTFFSSVGETIDEALSNDDWHTINDDYKCESFESLCLDFKPDGLYFGQKEHSAAVSSVEKKWKRKRRV